MIVSDGLLLITTAIMLQTAAMVVPGPNMLLLAAASIGGFRTILTTATGFAVSGTLFASFSIALIRIPALEQFGYTTFAILGILSGCYLIWIAFNLIRSCSEKFSLQPQNSTPLKSPFKTALFTNLANPKTLAFFVAIFGGMDASRSVSFSTLVAVVSIIFLNSIIVHSSIGHAISLVLRRNISTLPSIAIGYISALIFILFAMHSIFSGAYSLYLGN